MAVTNRKIQEKLRVKESIKGAAKKMFLEQGFVKTSIRKIAAEIQYSPGTIYLYFKDKNEIFLELHKEAFESFISDMTSFRSESTSAFENLNALGKHYLKFGLDNPEIYELLFIMIAPMKSLEVSNELWNQGQQALVILRLFVAESQKEGYFYDLETDVAAFVVYSFIHGLITLKLRSRLSLFVQNPSDTNKSIEDAYLNFVEMVIKTKKPTTTA